MEEQAKHQTMVSQQVRAITVEPEEELDTGVVGDVVSVDGDNGASGTRSGKKKERSSPDLPDSQVSKKKDLKRSPQHKKDDPKKSEQSIVNDKKPDWKKLLSRNEKREIRKNKPLGKHQKSLPKPTPRKSRRSAKNGSVDHLPKGKGDVCRDTL
nr:uncharacterized protein LOC118682708 [Bactrocera oleae]